MHKGRGYDDTAEETARDYSGVLLDLTCNLP
jgi:hypothetical protein